MKPPHRDRLSWGDTVFLNLEREGMPLNVACICVLEGDIPRETYLQFVESRLPLVPRYLMRLVSPPLNLGLPFWDYDPDFDIRRHVRELTLERGSDAELKALAGDLFGKVMDRAHPLWDLTLVHGLKGNRSAIIARMHHCLADGIAGVGVMSVLMDPSPAMPHLPKRKTRLRVPPPREDAPSLVTSLTDSYSTFMERVLSGWVDVLNISERALATAGTPPRDEFSTLVPEITAPTERLRFNVLYRGPQKFACTEIPLADVKAIRHACGTSINDVLLALVTATIRRYCELHGDSVQGRQFRVMIPVNLRASTNSSELGNRISLIAVTVPLDIKPPKKLLAEVHKRTEFLKHAHAAELVGLVGGLLGVLPFPVQAFVGPMISQVPVTPFNMVCTNVPGPQIPLYVLGHKMVHWYPYVPVGGELALNCAILSYNGMIYFGFSGDANITPDIERLEKLLQSNFEELRAAAGVKPLRATVSTKRPSGKISRAVPKPVAASRVSRAVVGSGSPTAPDLVLEKKPAANPVIEEKVIDKETIEERAIAKKMIEADERTVQATA